MKLTRSLQISRGLAAAIFLLAIKDSYACSCRAFESVVEADIEIVSTIFPSELLINREMTISMVQHTIKIVQVHSGEFNRVKVLSVPDTPGACGVTLHTGNNYRIRLPEPDKEAELVLNRCTITGSDLLRN